MLEAVGQRLGLAKEMFRRPWFRKILVVWAVISFWDTFVSEMLPEKVAANAPRVYKVFFWLLEMTSGWIPLWGWLLLGMAVLVVGSLEFAFRWTGEEKRRLRYLNPTENADKDMLDFLVEGSQAIDDITKTLDSVNKHTLRFAKMLNRYSRIVPFVTNFKLRRRLLSRVANNINLYSENLRKKADLIGVATPAVRNNQIRFIERLVISSSQDVDGLRHFSAVVGMTGNIVAATVESLESMRNASASIKGISGDLNAASSGLALVIDFFIDKARGFRAMCKEIEAVALKKLT